MFDSISKIGLPALFGLCIGASFMLVTTLPNKWVFTLVFAACYAALAITFRSLKRFMEALLIFSFSMVADFHVGYSWDPYLSTVRTGFPITVSSVILILLYILWVRRLFTGSDSVRLFPKVTVPFGLLIVWSGLSFFWAARPAYTLFNMVGLIEMMFLLVYAANALKSKSDIIFFVKCVAITVSISSIVAVCQYVTGNSFGLDFLGMQVQEQVMLVTREYSRAAAFLGHANGLSWFLNLWLPLLLLWGIAGPTSITKRVSFISFLVGFTGLVVTFSRAGWLSFGTSLVLIGSWLVTKHSRKMFPGIVHRVILVGMLVLVLAIPFSLTIAARFTRDDENAAYSRIPLAKVAINMIRYNALKGVGLGNYEYFMQKYDNTPEQIETPANPKAEPLAVHNIYLLLCAELGIFALAGLIFIGSIIFREGCRILKRQDRVVILFGVAILIGLAAYCVQGMVQPGGIGTTRFRPFWFLCGLLLGLRRFTQEKTADKI